MYIEKRLSKGGSVDTERHRSTPSFLCCPAAPPAPRPAPPCPGTSSASPSCCALAPSLPCAFHRSRSRCPAPGVHTAANVTTKPMLQQLPSEACGKVCPQLGHLAELHQLGLREVLCSCWAAMDQGIVASLAWPFQLLVIASSAHAASRFAKLHNTTQHNTAQRNTTQHNTTQHNTAVQHRNRRHSAQPHKHSKSTQHNKPTQHYLLISTSSSTATFARA